MMPSIQSQLMESSNQASARFACVFGSKRGPCPQRLAVPPTDDELQRARRVAHRTKLDVLMTRLNGCSVIAGGALAGADVVRLCAEQGLEAHVSDEAAPRFVVLSESNVRLATVAYLAADEGSASPRYELFLARRLVEGR